MAASLQPSAGCGAHTWKAPHAIPMGGGSRSQTAGVTARERTTQVVRPAHAHSTPSLSCSRIPRDENSSRCATSSSVLSSTSIACARGIVAIEKARCPNASKSSGRGESSFERANRLDPIEPKRSQAAPQVTHPYDVPATAAEGEPEGIELTFRLVALRGAIAHGHTFSRACAGSAQRHQRVVSSRRWSGETDPAPRFRRSREPAA